MWQPACLYELGRLCKIILWVINIVIDGKVGVVVVELAVEVVYSADETGTFSDSCVMPAWEGSSWALAKHVRHAGERLECD